MTDAVRLDYSNPSVVADPFAVYEAMRSSLPVPMIEPIDVSNAIPYLVSPAGCYVTCTTNAGRRRRGVGLMTSTPNNVSGRGISSWILPPEKESR
jgi:hypothetical protein